MHKGEGGSKTGHIWKNEPGTKKKEKKLRAAARTSQLKEKEPGARGPSTLLHDCLKINYQKHRS